MNYIASVIIFCIAVLSAGVSSHETNFNISENINGKIRDSRQTISKLNDAGLSLSKHVVLTKPKESNLVLSTASINVVLGMLAAGSKGQTQKQLLSFLKIKSINDLNPLFSELVPFVFADSRQSGGPRLSFANGIWIDKSLNFKLSFKQVMDKVYKAATERVDFKNQAGQVLNQVNSWAEKNTQGLIKDLLPKNSVDSNTRIVLANALYFKGAWNVKFDAKETKNQEFHLLSGKSVQAPFMTGHGQQMISSFDGFKVLSLPYKQGQDKRSFSMYLFLPNAKDGLQALAQKMGSEPGFLDRHIPKANVKVNDFRIPKFKISSRLDVKVILKGLGLELPFTSGLTEMADSPITISPIYHKSVIEVNEEGTEAAGGTGGAGSRSLGINFVADHPFVFLLRENKSGMVTFSGCVLNPLAG